MKKLALILMVRNESRILERCLKAVEGLVDAFCITDTGSTDTTCEIAREFLRTHEGCLTECEWKDFGTNRTISVESAQTYIEKVLGWDLKETYGLLLDADMVFVPGTIREYPLTDIGYTVVQTAGGLVYPNCRLIRLDYPWKCKGVTHEYWDGPTVPIPQNVCHIDDKNDGGCKSDKFERDIRLLERGLEEDPTNVRYMFYLAQTYHSVGRWKDSIAMYKKRIDGGGWHEEIWYSHYMIAQCYLALDDPIRFEAWMLRAYAKNPRRAEPLYKLAKYFREKGQQYKSFHYAQLGKTIPMSTESLFVERDVYTHLFDYEMTILDYYIGKPGLSRTIDYLLKKNNENVFSNMVFYVKPIGGGTPFPAPRDAFGPDFHPGSVCIWKSDGKTHANIRYVNYRLDEATRNTYEMCENGVYSTGHTVRTENAYMVNGAITRMNDASISLPRRPVHIRGLEDVRVFKRGDEFWFTATTLEYSENIRILTGQYSPETGSYKNCTVLHSPTGQPCEKNWLGIPHKQDFIYRWGPLQIGNVEENKLNLHTTYKMPEFFDRMRGSAGPLLLDDEYWVMTHVVEYSVPRKYYHMFVILDTTNYAPLRMSLPFVFEQASVEYCLGMCLGTNGIECVYSSMDDNPKQTTIPFSRLEWVKL